MECPWKKLLSVITYIIGATNSLSITSFSFFLSLVKVYGKKCLRVYLYPVLENFGTSAEQVKEAKNKSRGYHAWLML